jgi:hypothetical protein
MASTLDVDKVKLSSIFKLDAYGRLMTSPVAGRKNAVGHRRLHPQRTRQGPFRLASRLAQLKHPLISNGCALCSPVQALHMPKNA